LACMDSLMRMPPHWAASPWPVSRAVSVSIPLAMFAFFAELPWAPLMQGLAALIVANFFATSFGHRRAGPGAPARGLGAWPRGMIAATLIPLEAEAGLSALQQVITVVACRSS